MKKPTLLDRALNTLGSLPYRQLDRLYVPRDQRHIQRTQNIRLIPREQYRRGGKYAYGEWGHVIGIFQTLIFLELERKEDNRVLDIGCGTGLLGIATEPFLGRHGKYVGIDVMKHDIEFCRRHYPSDTHEFVHMDVNNPMYAENQEGTNVGWPVDGESFDLVTALSVWTHLSEKDAIFYFREIGRVLKPGGKAIVTFFLLNDNYRKTVESRSSTLGRFHRTRQDMWIFDESSYGSDAWFHPRWADPPEHAIGVTEAGLERLVGGSGLELITLHEGNWKERPGAFFQDVLVFRKT